MTAVTADPQLLVNFFRNLQTKKYMCDVIFKVIGEREVYGIKAILAARSSAFASKHCSNARPCNVEKTKKAKGTTSSKSIVIELPEYEYEEMCAFIEYIHCGICSIGPKILIGLHFAADEFELARLKEKCLRLLRENLSESNVLYFWKDLSRFQSKSSASLIVEILSEYISKNAEKILLGATIVILSQPQLLEVFAIEGLKISELSKFHAALIWTKAFMLNKTVGSSLHSVFAPFLNYIKLTRIPIQNLVEEVRRSKVVPERLLAHACAHNEMKEARPSGLKDDSFISSLKNDEASKKNQTPLVVGIDGSARSLSAVAANDPGAGASDGNTSYGKKVKRQSKNRYDLSQGAYYSNRPSSSSRLTKAKKLSASTPCLDLMF